MRNLLYGPFIIKYIDKQYKVSSVTSSWRRCQIKIYYTGLKSILIRNLGRNTKKCYKVPIIPPPQANFFKNIPTYFKIAVVREYILVTIIT